MSDWSSDVCSSGLVSDPRRTPTCDIADLHLPLNPGSDVPLFNGLLTWLAAHGVVDADFVAAHTCNLDAARSEEHTSELQSLMRISYAVFCLKKKKKITRKHTTNNHSYYSHRHPPTHPSTHNTNKQNHT